MIITWKIRARILAHNKAMKGQPAELVAARRARLVRDIQGCMNLGLISEVDCMLLLAKIEKEAST